MIFFIRHGRRTHFDEEALSDIPRVEEEPEKAQEEPQRLTTTPTELHNRNQRNYTTTHNDLQ